MHGTTLQNRVYFNDRNYAKLVKYDKVTKNFRFKIGNALLPTLTCKLPVPIELRAFPQQLKNYAYITYPHQNV